MTHRGFWILLPAASLASVAFLWLTCGGDSSGWCVPLGIPGEWTWNRIPHEDAASVLLDASLAVLGLLIYGTVVWFGGSRIAACSRVERTVWMTAMAVAGFLWLTLLQESPPAGYRSSKSIQVLYYHGSSGYYHLARREMTDVRAFLATYEARMAEGDVLHEGTHPPGLFLLHRALIDVCERSPSLVDAVLATQPQSAEEAAKLISQQTAGNGTRFRREDNAAIWLAALFTQAAGVLTVVPLYLLLRRTRGPQASFLGAALWPLVPALAVFLPKSDAMFPIIGMSFLYCWVEGCRRRSLLLSASAGLISWLGMFLSLAVLPAGLLALLLSVWEASTEEETDGNRWKQFGKSVVAAAVPFLAATLVLWFAFDVNLVNVWRWNVVNHSGFYDQYPRTYWKWLLVNPLELSLAVGFPVFLLAMAGCRRELKRAGNSAAGWKTRAMGPVVWCCFTFALLWLTGKNSGETARLWLFLMPWVVWLAAGMFESDEEPRLPKSAMAFILLQAVVCVATAMRVTGFHSF